MTLTLDRIEVTLMRISGRDLPTHQNYIEIGKTFCGRSRYSLLINIDKTIPR